MSEFRGSVLTAEELVRRRAIKDPIFPVRGPKVFYPTDSWLEGKQLQSLLDATKDLLAEERVERESLLARAEWDENLKIARVTQLVGNQFDKFGHEEGTTVFLHPEESLYLLETNHLEILYGGVSMSVQQAYMTLLNPKVGCTFLEYIVFSHLLKNGFKVLRHCPKRTVTRYERLIGLRPVRIKRKSEGKIKKVAKDIFSENHEKVKGIKKSNKEKNVTGSIKNDKRSKRHNDFKSEGGSEPIFEDISCVEVTVDNSSSFSDIEILSEKSVKDFKSDDMDYNEDCSLFSGSEDSDCQVVFSKGMGSKDYGKNSIEEINLSDSDESVCGENRSNAIKIEPSKLEILDQSENQVNNKIECKGTTDSICEISQIEGNCIQSEYLKESEKNVSLNNCNEQNLCNTLELSIYKSEDINLSLVNNVSVVSVSEIVANNTCSQDKVPVDSVIKEETGSQISNLLVEEKATVVSTENKSANVELAKDHDKVEVINIDDEPRILEDRWTILDSFPNAAGFHTIHCAVPPSYLCPPEVNPLQSVYTIVLERLSDPRFGGSQKRQRRSNSNVAGENNEAGNQRGGYVRNMSHRLPNWYSNRPFNKRFSSRNRFRGNQRRGRVHQHTHNHLDIRFPSNTYSPGSLMYPPLHSNCTPQRQHGPFPFYSDQSSFGHPPYEHNRRSPRWRDHSQLEELNQHYDESEFRFQGAQRGQRYSRRQTHSYRTSLESNRNDEPSSEALNDEGSFISLNLDNSHEHPSFQETSTTQVSKRRHNSSEDRSAYLCSRGKYARRGRERSFASCRGLSVTDFLNSVVNEQQSTPVQNTECYSANRSDVPNSSMNTTAQDYSSSDSHSSNESSCSESSNNVSHTSDESMYETEGEHNNEDIGVLLKPQSLSDVDEALNSIQLIKSAKLSGLSAAPDEPLLSIKFDLYLPTTHFRKSEPPVPDFRVVVMSPDQTLPSSRQLAFLEEGFDDGVPLLFAIASPDSVAFFLHSSVTFPQIKSSEKVQT